MKRLLSIVIAVLFLSALAACGSNAQTGAKETQTAAESEKKPTEIKSTAESETTLANNGIASEATPGFRESGLAAVFRKRSFGPGSRG